MFLAAEAPYPTIGGGAIRTASLLEYLARNYSVHAIVFREPGAPDPAQAIPPGRLDRLHVVDLPFHSKRPLARLLRNAARLARSRPPLLDRFSGFESVMAGFISGQQYDVALIEHFWNASYARVAASQRETLFLGSS